MTKLKDGFRGSRAIVLPDSIVREMEHDLFESNLYITDIGYYPKARHHFRKRENGASQYILIYCVDGKGWVESRDRKFDIAANQFFILPAGKPHLYGSHEKDPWTIYWLHFNGNMADFYADGYDTPTTISPTDESRIRERLAIFEEMYHVLENGYSKDNLNYAISSLYYFLGSIKYIGKFRESSGRQEHSKDVIEKAVLYMKEHIEKNLILDELCSYLRYSKSYFSNKFKRHTGYSPISYFIQLKIQAACHLLDFTDMQINQVCHKVGITDPYYFTKLFTKSIGYSPTRYREMKKG